MDVKNSLASLGLTYGAIIIKDVIPYFLKKAYSRKDNGEYNYEIVKDLKKDLWISFLRFPCDLIIIAATSIIARIIFCTNELSTLEGVININVLIKQLNTNHVLFQIIMFIFFPFCVFLVRLCESWYYPSKNMKVQKKKAQIVYAGLHLISLFIVIYILFIM